MKITRRSLVALPAAFSIAPARGVEWRQPFDTGSGVDLIQRSQAPLLSSATLNATEKALAQLHAIASQGGWPRLQPEPLRIGDNGEAVQALRRRLQAEGELASESASSSVYDTIVENAVKRVQARYGHNVTGALSAVTIADMNLPIATRIRQIEINLVRLRTLSAATFNQFVTVNIPSAHVEVVEGGRVIARHIAGVGKDDRQSPILTSKISEVNFNPYWTVPTSIIRKDLIPKMRIEPTYLTENKIRIFDSTGAELSPANVNWNSTEAMKYRFRQDPGGEFNSLGYVRINFSNPHGVYMHDTPLRGIFGDNDRFVSSGCVRMQNARGFVEWLLKGNAGWDRLRIDEEFRSGRRTDIRLTASIPLQWIYVTAWATADGAINFRDDIYRKDGLA